MDSAQLRAARGLLDWTQAKLAAEAGAAERTIWLFENGQRQPQRATLEKLRQALEAAGVVFIETDNSRGVLLPKVSH